jgi:hypothetical protein
LVKIYLTGLVREPKLRGMSYPVAKLAVVARRGESPALTSEEREAEAQRILARFRGSIDIPVEVGGRLAVDDYRFLMDIAGGMAVTIGRLELLHEIEHRYFPEGGE